MSTILWPKVFVALALGAAAASPLLGILERPQRRLGPSQQAAVFLGSRLLPFALVFGVLGMRLPTDIREYFYPQAVAVADGLLPMLDFETSYNVGFPLLLGFVVGLVDSPLALMALMIAAEAAAVWLFADMSRRYADGAYDRVLLLWLLNPVSFVFVALGGQDEALILAFAALAGWLLRAAWPIASGIVVLVGVLATKLIAVPAFAAVLAFPAGRIARVAIGFGIGAAVAVGLSLASGVALFGASNELGKITSGNIWTLIMLAQPAWPAGQLWQYALVPPALAALTVYCWARPWPPAAQFMRIWAIVGAAFMVLSPKTYGMYVVMFLPALLYLSTLLPPAIARAYYLLFFPLLVIEQALWFYVGGTAGRLAVVIAVADLLLLSGHLLLILRGLRPFEPEPTTGSAPGTPPADLSISRKFQ